MASPAGAPQEAPAPSVERSGAQITRLPTASRMPLVRPAPAPVLVEVVRSGFVESRHRGCGVALDADGAVAFAAGAVDHPIFPRSAGKVPQATAMLRAGLELDSVALAVAAGSHAGQSFHINAVRRILAGAGLDESALQTPPDLPLDDEERRAYVRAGGEPSRLVMNCSGQHAAMLATCVARGWPTESYPDPAHPLQVTIAQTLTDLAQEPIATTGIDGCGVALFAVSLLGLARAFRAHVVAAPGSVERRVADAMRRHPRFAGGSRRPDSLLMMGVPGLLAKDGTEGVFAVALPDGRAAAVKIEDGALRAALPVIVALLRKLGVRAAVLDQLGSTPLQGGDRIVGEIRATDLDALG